MKRYEVVHNFTRAPDGDYIRHDDPDLAALVAAASEMAETWRLADSVTDVPPYGQAQLDQMDNAHVALLRALAAVAGTTTRGRA